MYKLTLTCKVITPMFMSGSDGRSPELRPSEFKGLMRFWWRAIKAEKDITKLKNEEFEIFGGIGEKANKSKIKIRLYPQPSERDIGKNIKNDYKLDWYYDRNSNILKGNNAGIGYLFYSTVLTKSERKYIKPGFPFNLQILSFDEYSFKNAIASLWVAIYLGGFGTRSRRGGGNISVSKIEGNSYDLSFLLSNISSKLALKKQLEDNLKKIFSFIKNKNTHPLYPNLKGSRIVILDPEKTWHEALNKIGIYFKQFREANKRDIFNMGIFGMPIIHNNLRVRIVPYQKNNEKRLSDRMASPLIIKLIEIENNYFPLIIKLSIIPPLVVKEEKMGNEWIKKEIKKIDSTKIDEFLNEIKNKEEIYL